MAEKRFTVVVYDDKAINGFAVLDLQKPNNTLRLKYESVYIGSKEGCEIVCGFGNSLAEENKELQVQCNLLREQSNEFHRGARENANGVGQLEKENKELKEENEQLKHDATVLICSNQEYRKKNEQLKQLLDYADDLIQSHLSEHFIRQWRNFKTGHKEYNEFWEEKIKKHNELKESVE